MVISRIFKSVRVYFITTHTNDTQILFNFRLQITAMLCSCSYTVISISVALDSAPYSFYTFL